MARTVRFCSAEDVFARYIPDYRPPAEEDFEDWLPSRTGDIIAEVRDEILKSLREVLGEEKKTA